MKYITDQIINHHHGKEKLNLSLRLGCNIFSFSFLFRIRFRYEDEEGNLKEIRMKDDEIFEVLIRKKTDTSEDVEAGCSASPPKKAKN